MGDVVSSLFGGGGSSVPDSAAIGGYDGVSGDTGLATSPGISLDTGSAPITDPASGFSIGGYDGLTAGTSTPAGAGAIGSTPSGIIGGYDGLTGGTSAPTASPVLNAITSAPVAPVAAPTIAPQTSIPGTSGASSIPNPSGSLTPDASAIGGYDGVGASGQSSGATSTPASAITGGGTASGASGILQKLFGTGGKGGILPELVGGGAILKDLISAGQLPPGGKAIQTEAGTQAGLANSYAAQAQGEGEGILPAGAQALIQQNLNANIAAIQQKYASLGMSGSSAEIQDINAARNQALSQTFQIGNTLAQQGLQEVTSASGLEANLLQALMSAETAQNTQLGDALASFAGAGTDVGRAQPTAAAA